MKGDMASGPRAGLSRGSIRAILVVIGVALLATLIISRLPPRVAAVGTLDECVGGWPIVTFEGDDWSADLPDDLPLYGPRQMPVAAWPSGMRFDEAAGVLLDEKGGAVFRRGDRVRVSGTIVETDGDPAPCFFLRGLKIETIAAP